MIRLRGDSDNGWSTWIALIAVMAVRSPPAGRRRLASPEESEPAESEPAESEPAAALEPIPMRIGALNPQTGGLSGIVGALEEAAPVGRGGDQRRI